jgi:hypothetical protein
VVIWDGIKVLTLLPVALLMFQGTPTTLTQRPSVTASETPPAPVSADGEIIVNGTTRLHVASMIKRMTGDSDAQIPRWNTSICVTVRGAVPDKAQYIAETVAVNARTVGVPIEGRSCPPNVEIIISNQADALVSRFLRRQPNMFRNVARYGIARSRNRAELTNPSPVRWTMGTATERRLGAASRLSQPSREDKKQILVIIDLPRCGDVTWEQLSSYVSMVVLANPEHSDSSNSGSIMSLFDANTRDRPNSLTDLDRLLLKALYATEDQVSAASQQYAMTDYIVREQNKRRSR